MMLQASKIFSPLYILPEILHVVLEGGKSPPLLLLSFPRKRSPALLRAASSASTQRPAPSNQKVGARAWW